MMAKKIKKIMAMVLALCICFSALPLQALAAEGDGTVETTVDGVKITTTTTTTETQKDPATGDTTITVTIQKESEGTKTSTGEKVNGSETKVTVKEKDSDGNEKVMSSETKSTTTVTDENGKKVTTKVEDGYERTETEVPDSVKDVPVQVSTKTDDPSTEENEGQNVATTPTDPTKEPEIKGDEPKGEDDKNYNYTETTEEAGKVTVTTTGVKIEEKVDKKNTDLEYVMNDTTPDGTNDLIHENPSLAPADRLPGSDVEDPAKPEGGEGYDYVYVGTGNTSQFRPAIVFKTELTEEQLKQLGNPYLTEAIGKAHSPEDLERAAKDENGNYVKDEAGFLLDENGDRILRTEKTVVGADGKTYYLHRIDGLATQHMIEGWYQDGEWVEELGGDKFGAVYATSQQFVLVDKNTNESFIAYCADATTVTEKGFGYTMENLQDATYYSQEEADHIRSIAQNGYWGTVGTEVDEDGNTVPKKGSLAAMKEKLRVSGQFTPEEIDALTDGVAQTATQMAIWSYSNKMEGVEFVNTHYVGKPGDVETNKQQWHALENVPEDKKFEAELMFKIYEYLVALDPVRLEGTTKDTLINADNFVEGMEITVLEKAKNHDNNKDKNNKNDAYVTNLTFALVVEIDEKNGDNLKVSVVDSEGNPILNAEGQPVVGRIAGELQDGEVPLDTDNDGNYCFQNIVLTEGENTFRLNLEGIQNLQEGVYLYSSEVTEEGESSQTLVGLAGGKRGVNVSMDLEFKLDVKDKVVVKEHYWHSEKTNTNPPGGNVPPQGPNVPPQEPPQVFNLNREGVVEIIDEQVPLAAAPKTGDASFLFIALALFAAISLCAANFDKKRKHETF